MLTVSGQRANSRASETPCPSCPITQAHGLGSAAGAVAPWHASWWPPGGTRSSIQVVGGQALDQLQTEVRAHAGAQHLRRQSAAVP